VVRQVSAHGDRLIAHLVPTGADHLADEVIRAQLRDQLPDYMTPAAVVWHESLPLTRNGKIDRARLTMAIAITPASPAPTAGPATPTERALAGLWAAVLRVADDDVAPDRSLYDLGGDSLSAARILTGVRKRFGVSITLDRLHEVQTVRAMAAWVDAAGGVSRD
jgi:pyochelin synthetase